MSRDRLEWLVIIALATLMGAGWVYVSRDTTPSTGPTPVTTAPYVGNLAPDFTLMTAGGVNVTGFTPMTVDSNSITLSDFRDGGGRPVVLNFWATWCPPCRVEMPYFDRVSAKYQDRVAILGINQAESDETIVEYATRNGLTYTLLTDRDMKVNNLYGVLNLPTTIFIDKNGVVREVLVGTINQAVLEDRIEQLLDS